MAYKDKQIDNQYKNNWQTENKDRIILLVDKGEKERLKEMAEAKQQSLNAWILDAIERKKEARSD